MDFTATRSELTEVGLAVQDCAARLLEQVNEDATTEDMQATLREIFQRAAEGIFLAEHLPPRL